MRACYGKLYGAMTEDKGNYGFVHLLETDGSDRISKARLQAIKFPFFSFGIKEIKSLFPQKTDARKEVPLTSSYKRELLSCPWLSPSPSFSKGDKMSKSNLVVAIDLGKYLCQALIYKNGIIIETFSFPNVSFSGLKILLDKTLRYGKDPVFVFEATNVFWRPLYFHLLSAGYQCFTVSSSQTGASRKTKTRKTQTDKIDCKEVMEIYLKGEAHPTKFPPEPLVSLRELTRLYTHLVDTKTNLCYRIRENIYQLFPEWETCFSDIFCKSSLSLMEKQISSPQVLTRTRKDKLAHLLEKSSYGKFSMGKTEQLKEKAANSFGISVAEEAFSFNLSILVKTINSIQSQLSLLQEKIENLFSQVPQQLLTVPGLDIIPAACFVSELGQPDNFSDADQVVAWFGLDVVWKSSAGKGKGYHISKTGTPYGRKWMFVAAGEFIRHFQPARERYLKIFKEQKVHKKAIIPITADLVKISFAMYRDGSAFDPTRYH
ncbi:MAG: IS110 family transposase [Candidatus Omnitrophica bacterium]|nr:IS110 family transposase [Candidatus Omnitrophota bacterium]